MSTTPWTQLWLEYRKVNSKGNEVFVKKIVLDGFDAEQSVIKNALKELKAGVQGMLGVESVSVQTGAAGADMGKEPLLLIKRQTAASGDLEGAYRLAEKSGSLSLLAGEETGVLYGVFHILRMIATETSLKDLDVYQSPSQPLRMMNHWDNLDGSIERGYSGRSFYFRNNEFFIDDRTRDFARFLASIGINGVVINNVNVKEAATYLITDRYFDKVTELSELFAEYGIKLYLSLNFASPIELGGPQSADPLDAEVISWWKEKMAEVFDKVPKLGGFLVKADSEGRPGPFTYGRTQADGANMLADIVKPYGALIIWRCFVYNCTQDWRDYKTDRARAQYDNFIEMDGDYHDNVILQIKNGPMDFQIREPVAPLLGGLKKTNQMMEVQIAQEYTGHQIDVCYLMPMFKEILEFRTYCNKENDTVADIIGGGCGEHRNLYTGIAAVINTGNDANWTGNVLAAANLYGFGRLAFDNKLSAKEIAQEWIRMTLSNEEEVVEKILSILLSSREVYEHYTSPLGIGWMVTPHVHYGCSVDGYEYSRWGTYHRADHLGIGVDRTDSGTGYVRQYNEPNASRYNDINTCPEELLLFFHHVPYVHVLSSGKTLIQHIYDTHFEGVEEVETMIACWETLEGKVPAEAFANVRERFERQLANAKDWRDQVNSYFYRKSGIPDAKERIIY
ncbi:MAG: alpha-glucuronidase [Lachnospiraceae bacterium]|nr:alpha-glucuronidase [Lachnospiraceae bacterium]